jgi:hypothetical protein
MKIVLTILIFIHGLIHFMGFAKAFNLGDMAQFTKEIPKPMGVLWLLTGLLFITSAGLNFMKNTAWPILAIMAVAISQLLIVTVWKDAGFGTIANVIVLAVGIATYGNYKFGKMVFYETEGVVPHPEVRDTWAITKDEIGQLPEIVQKWMQVSGVIGKERIVSVRLRQKGEMKTRPNGKWMPFTAEQYFNVLDPAFVWATEVDLMPMIKMVGRDKFTGGKGEILIKLAALIPVVDEAKNEKINSAAMIRYLAEMAWFPSATLNDYIQWETMDTHTAKATFTIQGKAVSGLFKFSDTGEMASFSAERYYGTGEDATLESWFVRTEGHKDFKGYRIPAKCQVVWKLKEGDFNWLHLEITQWECNTLDRFEK